jgi:hypothetical protein
MAYKLIRAKIACKVEGRHIGEGLNGPHATAGRSRPPRPCSEPPRGLPRSAKSRRPMARNDDAKAEAAQRQVRPRSAHHHPRRSTPNGQSTTQSQMSRSSSTTCSADDVKGVTDPLRPTTAPRAASASNVYLWEHARALPQSKRRPPGMAAASKSTTSPTSPSPAPCAHSPSSHESPPRSQPPPPIPTWPVLLHRGPQRPRSLVARRLSHPRTPT